MPADVEESGQEENEAASHEPCVRTKEKKYGLIQLLRDDKKLELSVKDL